MNRQYISASLFTFALFLITPHISAAYFTTAQKAVLLNPTTALLTIEYAFGMDDYDLYMPVRAARDQKVADQKEVGYTILENGTTTNSGTATGIVVSKAPIVDSTYKLAKGVSQKMTLIVLYTSKLGAFEEDYALQVTSLPYSVDKGGSTLQALHLNPTELQYYITPEVELNTGNYKK